VTGCLRKLGQPKNAHLVDRSATVGGLPGSARMVPHSDIGRKLRCGKLRAYGITLLDSPPQVDPRSDNLLASANANFDKAPFSAAFGGVQ
jgi:hypothetical protein